MFNHHLYTYTTNNMPRKQKTLIHLQEAPDLSSLVTALVDSHHISNTAFLLLQKREWNQITQYKLPVRLLSLREENC
jgi:hypothetical protein